MAHESHASDSVAPYRIMGPEDTVHEEDARVCVDTLKAKIKNGVHPSCRIIELTGGRHH